MILLLSIPIKKVEKETCLNLRTRKTAEGAIFMEFIEFFSLLYLRNCVKESFDKVEMLQKTFNFFCKKWQLSRYFRDFEHKVEIFSN